jgi:hypothetical protein
LATASWCQPNTEKTGLQNVGGLQIVDWNYRSFRRIRGKCMQLFATAIAFKFHAEILRFGGA